MISRQSRCESFNLTWSIRWRGRSVTASFNKWIAVAAGILIPVLAAWYLGATLYLVFHDQLLASLLARQTDLQYAYEDRIAALKTQLDRETSRGLMNQRTLATTMADLNARGTRLETRAAELDRVLDQALRAPPSGSNALLSDPLKPQSPFGQATHFGEEQDPALPGAISPGVSLAPLDPAPSDPALRLDGARKTSALGPSKDDRNRDVGVDARAERLLARFARLNERQEQAIARVRRPVERSVQLMQAALAQSGVSYPRSDHDGLAGFAGGPFVPLPSNAVLDFETSVALLEGAVQQQQKLSGVIATVPLRRPLAGTMAVTSGFGARLDPFLGRPAMHTGIDLLETYGDKVTSTAAGTVTVAGSGGGYGNMVEIDHGNGLTTRYAHMSAIEVVPHQRVEAGAIVGRVGSTGRATGPHLHYETRINGEPIDPSRFLRAGAALFPG